ncbi:MAG: DUF4198 domain-containing protein [Acidobacteriota bacterium]|nr:DUF4198 domain-containing protein [Acidobacteriota bacterium]
MRPKALTISVVLLLMVLSVSAHDLFLKFDSYFLAPNAKAKVQMLNGTFQSSDGIVRRDRMRDISLIAPDAHVSAAKSISWRDVEKTTTMEIQTGGPGTYVVGISTRPREIDLKAAEFNDYLKHDGIPDILAKRTRDGELGKHIRERYSKHVRAIFQVGSVRTEEYRESLHYPVEIIPQNNPYSLRVGQTLPVQCTLDGKPLANQFVMAGWESVDGKLHSLDARTDAKGIARFKLMAAGKWFVKLIHMAPSNEAGINYESKWATLTFQIR